MEDLHSRGGYTPLSLDGYARATAAFISHLREDIVIQRITGDPHPNELVAPLWALEKVRVREAIHQALAKDNLSQGCRRVR